MHKYFHYRLATATMFGRCKESAIMKVFWYLIKLLKVYENIYSDIQGFTKLQTSTQTAANKTKFSSLF